MAPKTPRAAQPAEHAIYDAVEGVPFTVNGVAYTGRCLTLRDGIRFQRLYRVAIDDSVPVAEAEQAIATLVDEFPAAIGHPEPRWTLGELLLVLRRFLYLLRGMPAPKEAPPAPAPTAPAAPTSA